MIGSGSSQEVASYSYRSAPLVQGCLSDSLSAQNRTMCSTPDLPFSESSAQDRTMCSTPDLPFSESSDLLDIPFASLFDLMDFSEAPENLASPTIAARQPTNDSSGCSSHQHSNCPAGCSSHQHSNCPTGCSSHQHSNCPAGCSSRQHSNCPAGCSSRQHSNCPALPAITHSSPSNEVCTVSSRNSSLSSNNSSLCNEDSSLCNEDSSLCNEDSSLCNKDSSLCNKDSSLCNKDSSLCNKDVSVCNEDLSSFNGNSSLTNDNSSMCNDDLSVSKEESSVLSTDLYRRQSLLGQSFATNVSTKLGQSFATNVSTKLGQSFATNVSTKLGQSFATNVSTKSDRVVSGTQAAQDQHSVFHEPMVKWVQSQSGVKSTDYTRNCQDYILNNNYTYQCKDTSREVELTNKAENCQIYRQIPATVNQLIVQSQSAGVNASMLPLVQESALCEDPSFWQCSSFVDTSQPTQSSQPTQTREQVAQQSILIANHTGNNDFSAQKNSSWSYYDLPETNHIPEKPESAARFHYNISTTNDLSSNFVLPHVSQNNAFNTSACKTHAMDFITTRSKLPSIAHQMPEETENRNASKRRKYNHEAAQPVRTRQQNKSSETDRQTLSFKSPTNGKKCNPRHKFSSSPRPASARDTLHKDLNESAHLKSLMLQKENNFKPYSPAFRSQRKPFAELRNLNTPVTALKNLTENYTEYNKTSQGVILPSRQEELLSRDAYYCDFTVDRQIKIDDYMSRKTHDSNMPEEQDGTHNDTSANESFVRQVEGAERSPLSFKAQSTNRTFSKVATHVNRNKLKSKTPTTCVNKNSESPHLETDKRSTTRGSSSNTHKYSRRSILKNTPGTFEHPKKESPISRNIPSQHATRSTSKSSRIPISKSCTSHPIASSTIIQDSSSCSSGTEGSGSDDTWSDNGDGTSRVFGKSYLQSTTKERKRKMTNFRPMVPIKMEGSKQLAENVQDMRSFEISAMVSRIDQMLTYSRAAPGDNMNTIRQVSKPGIHRSHAELEVPKPKTNNNMDIPCQHILAGAKSFLKHVVRAPNSLADEADSGQYLSSGSKQTSASSTLFNNAKESIVFTSREGSGFPEQGYSSDRPTQSKHISVSEPEICRQICLEEEDRASFLGHEDMDVESTSISENKEHIPRKSGASNGSFCCKGRHSGRRAQVFSEKSPLVKCNVNTGQDLLDSILTDSPKSVNSSGIFAPDNSHTIPLERTYHNDACSTTSGVSTLWSVISSSTGHPNLVSTGTSTSSLISARTSTSNLVSTGTSTSASPKTIWPRLDTVGLVQEGRNRALNSPHPPALVASSLRKPHSSRNQDTITSSVTSIPQSLSVKRDHADRHFVFAATPGIITGPPKIKSKNSLVRKFRKFSSNFFKKTERIQVLANL